MRFSTLANTAVLAGVTAATNYLGFNSGATLPNRSAKFKADFEAEFNAAQKLVGAPGTFNAVRLYTNVQAYSKEDPIQAFEAAMATNTYLLLGIWTSGTADITPELNALKTAISKYGTAFTKLVIGMSIGSEDLYRDSATGRLNKAGVGNGPQQIMGFIKDYKNAVAGTPLSGVPIGHVDTWDAWTNGTNKQLIDAIDWMGVDEYPFYESGKGNDIKNAGTLFDTAYDATLGVANGKPVWVTETGWPTSGPNWDQAVPSVANAEKYWQEVGCRRLFNKTPTFWYNLRDSNPDNEVKFGVSPKLSPQAQFNLTCPTTFDTPSHTTSRHTSSTTSSGASNASHTTLTASPTSTAGEGAARGSDGAGVKPTTVPTGAASVNGFNGAAYAGAALAAGYMALL